MAIYNPNSSGSTGFYGGDGSQPPDTHLMDSETEFSSAELDTLSADDDNNVNTSYGGYVGHRFQFAISETPADISSIDALSRGYGDNGGGGYYYGLYIWNNSTSSWELLDSHTQSSKATVQGSVSVNCSNYVYNSGGTNYIDLLVMGPTKVAIPPALLYNYYVELEITAAAGGGGMRSQVIII